MRGVDRWADLPGTEALRQYGADLAQIPCQQAGLGVGDVILRVKSNYSAPADPAIVAEIPKWDAVVSGIGD